MQKPSAELKNRHELTLTIYFSLYKSVMDFTKTFRRLCKVWIDVEANAFSWRKKSFGYSVAKLVFIFHLTFSVGPLV